MKSSTTDKPVLAIGDVHGHLNRLEALLRQGGIIGECPNCGGSGDKLLERFEPELMEPRVEEWSECPTCQGDGVARLRDDCLVVQLGDLGHFGSSWEYGKMVPGSSMGDMLTYSFAKKWIDIVLWGNHDRAVIDKYHEFTGYIAPAPETFRIMKDLRDEGRQLLAYSAHGFLLTHAGLHSQFKHNQRPEETTSDPVACAKFINEECDLALNGITDAISTKRGGRSVYGGILWRDASESLYGGFRQIFGHTSKPKIRRYYTKAGVSLCIDVGDKDNGRLAGIWLPEERIVEVNLKDAS